jgi:hypothetical protein
VTLVWPRRHPHPLDHALNAAGDRAEPLIGTLAVTLTLCVACGGGGGPAPVLPDAGAPPPPSGPAAPRDDAPRAPPVVVFVVLDTVRADHTSVCGYDRPTTPTLADMVAKGAALSCRTYSPAPWTHPSHASLFTGRSVVEHEAVWVSKSAITLNPVTTVRPLDDARFVTVAERFRDAGYQTLAVTGNMIVTPGSGLLQGFDHVAVPSEAYELRGNKHLERMKAELAKLDPTRPLFLFLNFYDAHDPYPPIPERVPWLPQQPLINLHPNQHDPENPYFKFIKGVATPKETRELLKDVRNGYDWGVHQADAGLGAALQQLIDDGWFEDGFRVVVTADHGEMLGEHQLLRHGGFLYEGVVRVPMLYFDSTATTQPALPDPASGLWVHDLLLWGELPRGGPPVHAVSEPNERDPLIGTLGAAVWSNATTGEADKGVCWDGERGRYDLRADPGERELLPLVGSGLVPPLKELCARVDALHRLPPPATDRDQIKQLIAVGYLDADALDQLPPAPPEATAPTDR